MFQHAGNRIVMRAAAAVAAPTNVDLPATVSNRDGALFFSFLTAGRTVGTCTCTVQFSADNSTWYDAPAEFTTTINANGRSTIQLRRVVDAYARVVLTPGGGFDGTVKVDALTPHSRVV
jgi:hypothetical protein